MDALSVDGYGKINDYIRYPSDFQKIENNIYKIHNFLIKEDIEIDMNLCPTVQYVMFLIYLNL